MKILYGMGNKSCELQKNAVENAKIDLENPNYYGDKPELDIRPDGDKMNRPLHLFTASAGSGKTWRLAFEYISLLLKDAFLPTERQTKYPVYDNYRHILAITFTNKATAEMKDRILANLAMLSGADVADEKTKERDEYLGQLAKRLNVSKQIVADRARLVYANLLHDYSHFHIQTIDSFFQSVLRNLAQELGIGSYWEVELDAESVLKDAAHRLLNRVRDDEKLRSWVTDYVKERLDDNKNWNVEGELVSFGSNLFSEALVTNDEMDNFLADDPENPTLRKRIANIKRMVAMARNKCKEEVPAAAQKFLDFCSTNGIPAEHFTRKVIYNYAQSLANGEMKEATDMVLNFLNATTPDEMASKAFPKARQQNYISVVPDLHSLLLQTNRIFDENNGKIIVFNQILKNINQIGMLADIKNEVAALQEEQNIFMLAYAQPLLHKFISNDDAPFVFERIGESLRFMMIDEFQDTSKVQFQNFRPLIQNCCAENSGSLIVGDAKQAIYRFRNGDWTLIESLRKQSAGKRETDERLFMPTPILGHDMQFNFRSSENVVNFNNAVFRADFTDDSYAFSFPESVVSLVEKSNPNHTEYLRQVYSTSYQFPKKESAGFVKVKFHQKTDADKEVEVPWTLQALLAEVRQLNNNGVEFRDMTILSRFNKDIPKIAAFLKQHDIPVVSDLAFLLRASIKVRLIIDALRYVDAYLSKTSNSPNDQLFKKELMCDYLRYLHSDDAVFSDFTEELPVVEQWCEVLRGDVDLDGNRDDERRDVLPSLPIYDMVEVIYLMIFPDTPTDEYVQSFLDHLRDYLAHRVATVRDVLKFWDDSLSSVSIPADPKKANGVRMLSIHKSKGLEGHTVILANCSWSVTADRISSFWCSGIGKLGEGMEEAEIPMLPIDFSSKLENTTFAPEYWEEMAQLHAENVNLLYVALTRAKHNLVVIDEFSIPKKEKEGYECYQSASMGRLLYGIFNPADLTKDPVKLDDSADENEDLCFSYGDVVPTSVEKSVAKDQLIEFVDGSDTYPIKGRFRQSTAANAFVVHGDIESSDSVDFGLQMHNLLSFIVNIADTEHPDYEITKAAHQLTLEGVLNAGQEEEFEKMAVGYFLNLSADHRKDWFGLGKKVYNESNIILYGDWTSEKMEEKRPDRLVYDAETNTYTVIDYKTGKSSSSHVEQVRQYMQLVSQLRPGSNVKGYLWYLNNNKVNEVFFLKQ